MSLDDRGPRVLVVDDDDLILRFAERVLQDGGYEVVVASSGPQALDIAKAQRPFAGFVLDVMMPTMRGDELARQLRHVDPDVRVLYFTGRSDALFDENATLWENEAFVDKPVTVNGLREAVSLLLFGHTHGPR